MARLVPYLEALRAHYGRPRVPKPQTPFEPFVRAILTPGASPKSLEKALQTLRIFGLSDPDKIRDLDPETIALAIKPVAGAHAKAIRLKTFVAWFADRFGGDLDRLRAVPAQQLREELLGIGGFGPEAVDLILQRALGLPTAVVDTFTYRVLTRHDLAIQEAAYEDLKDIVETQLPREAWGEFHSLMGQVGREFCRPQARCDRCPLKPLLPRGRGPA
ncbi:MAG TPA: endonuclease III domain-containing protein [Planctomycetota bacterium]|nr:endonuclease III domain-containing protein [Planctomycetota bacterium]